MDVSSAEITGILGAYLWPFFRIAAMVMVAPIFSSNFISQRSRILMAVAISIVIVPNIPVQVPQVDALSAEGLLIIAHQILIGACMGFMLQLLFNAFIVAGQIIAMQMGLGFASMVDPQNGVMVPVISQFYLVFITLIFVSINGHLILIQVMSESFVTLPIAATGLSPVDFRDIVAQASWMYAAGVIIALPAIGSLMMVNLAFGILSRAAPQISPFSIGFPMTIILGFVVMLITLPNVAGHLVNMSDYMLQMARLLVQKDG
ncbi:flagellar biosynthetic protein FliR [Methylophaga thiooxydans]|uniref:Flagellar biosynthetic protein FliR n=1 Tax=Methylophaga thiooxydans DMS010 TaxID=637616 RepID=C0N6X3_9GAMM|nr:flagellar biosynthetic protein FliR [Methylophaga thiooxydans]EEF79501.1 flagellar biosynthetic protein FliR [Methylophaga thiooxydans DMS010]